MPQSLPEKQLTALLTQAEAAHSDAVAIMHDGELVNVWRFGKAKMLIETMSVTKSIVSLAVGRLMTLGQLETVDMLICQLYPEWKQGRKADITLRHLMGHTSGLQNVPNARTEIYPALDVVQLALCAELEHDPGTRFAYNNKAVNLIAGIVEKISGSKLDVFTADEVFAPLGITDYTWMRDAAGNPHVMAGLELYPEDLAKLGQLVINQGRWQDTQIIRSEWFEESLQPSFAPVPSSGLLWWRLHDVTWSVTARHVEAMAASGVSASKLYGAVGEYHAWFEYANAMETALGSSWRDVVYRLTKDVKHVDEDDRGLIGYYAEGWLGQYLYVFPKQSLVVVRLIHEDSVKDKENVNFPAFEGLVLELARAIAGKAY
ncbi:MAG: serine hydrolase [Deinococcota bacterium]